MHAVPWCSNVFPFVGRISSDARVRFSRLSFCLQVQHLERVLLDKEKQMKTIQEERSKDRQQVVKMEHRLEEVNMEKDKYKSTIEHMRQNSQGRVKQLEHEVASLQALNASLKRRLSDLTPPDVNKENACVALEAERREHRESSSRQKPSKHVGRSQSLSQSFDAGDYVRMRHSSSRSSRGSNSSIHSIHELDPRYLSPPTSHRSHRHGSASDSEKYHRSKSGSRTSLSSVHSQTHVAQTSSAHTQASSGSPFVRGSSARSTAPARGVVAPQRRMPPQQLVPPPQPPLPQPSPSSPFMRHDKSRITLSPSRSKSVEVEPFSRDNRLRATMPERRTVYVTPERRTPVEKSASPEPEKMHYMTMPHRHSSASVVDGYHTLPLPDKHQIYASTGVAMNSPNLEKSPSFHEKWKDCGSDSGHATSPDSPESSSNFESNEAQQQQEGDKEKQHRRTSVEIRSSETIRSQFRSTTRNSQVSGAPGGEKWKYFVDKIVDLQDKNQKLILQNSELKKLSNTKDFTSDLLRSLKERNLILEVENRKLKKIIEMLQGGGRNPNDPREYHFYTNV